MQKHYETVTDERGNVLVGYRVRVKDSAGGEVAIYQDRGGTRFRDSAGNIINETITDSLGRYEFYWEPVAGQYRELLDASGNLRDSLEDFASVSGAKEEVVTEIMGILPYIILSEVEGANDEAKLNAAVLTASAAGGGVIVIDNDLECDGLSFASARTNVTLRGANPQTTIRLTSSNNRAVYIQGAGWRLENLTIECQGLFTSAGVEVRGNNFSADNVTFDFGADVINTVGLNFAQGASDCRVTNCKFIGGELQLIAQTGAKRIVVDNCSFTGAAHKGIVGRGNAAGGGDMMVTNCTFTDSGIDCQPVRFEYVSHDFPGALVANCTFIDTVKRAGGNEDTVTFNGVSKFRAIGNYINRASDVGVNASTGASDGVIANNVIVGTYNGAVNLGQLNGDTLALAGSRTQRVLVANNTAIDCGDRWDNPALGSNSPYVYFMALRTTDCAFIGNTGTITGNQVYAPIRGALFGDNQRLIWQDNTLKDYTDTAEFSQIATDSPIMGAGAITSQFWRVDGAWPYEPTMTSGAPGGSQIYHGGALKIWNGSAWAGITERARRVCVTTNAGASPTFTTTGDIAGSRTGTGVYVYTFATALPADAIINVRSNINAGRTRTTELSSDRLTLTVYLWTTTTANDHNHTVVIA